ncbi:MAG TPA: thiol reductant ABC exporter subunit CydC [Mycobacterium sp.]|uniref:thiol reductant ABC exporter subunit CydC n=1 Tax=Mycobacterium sp. TaxID=1785 RepID=UPI002D4EDF97|nr:thiol reductant ABC exporter subunit CydC [Mycobacterium sp.]HZU46913.1 thiol reductant ABC exporter subunit CydC [Mycobacterium sp.]
MSETLLTAAGLLRPRLSRLLLAVTLGVLALSSALALAGVSAWLITRAWQMPPVLDLSVAVVMVRALAISRGVLHYCERLATHDAALRSAGSARARIYQRLARGPVDAVARLHSGQLVTRVGADVDELADVLVRAVLPIAVAAVLGVAATAVVAVISLPAALALAACLLAAGVFAPYLAATAATAQETVARHHLSDRNASAMIALEHAPELRVGGVLPDVIAESTRQHRRWAGALDAAAKPAAVAEAMPTAAIALSVLGAVIAGIGMASSVAPTTLAILMLLPLSAFEATNALPGAAIQLTRSRIAACRLSELTQSADPQPVIRAASPTIEESPWLLAADIRTGYPDGSSSVQVSVDLPPGARLAVTGPSGCGKTTLLMTLAGLLPPLHGRVELNGTPVDLLSENELRRVVCFFAEDAHIFATTVRDNLLVSRGDCGDDELIEALHRVGLGHWLGGLPDGLTTVLTGGAQAVSAGQRRRLLLARAVISPAPIVLLDEPTEHLDAVDTEALLRELLSPDGGLMTAARTVVVATHHLPNDIRCPQLRIGHDEYADCRLSTPADGER